MIKMKWLVYNLAGILKNVLESGAGKIMLNPEIRELLKYLKNIVADETPDHDVMEKYRNDPDFIELDEMVRGIRSACKKHFEMIFDLFPDPTIITTPWQTGNYWFITRHLKK